MKDGTEMVRGPTRPPRPMNSAGEREGSVPPPLGSVDVVDVVAAGVEAVVLPEPVVAGGCVVDAVVGAVAPVAVDPAFFSLSLPQPAVAMQAAQRSKASANRIKVT